MKLNGTYKFPNFNVELSDLEMDDNIKIVAYDLDDKIGSVSIVLTTANAKFGITLEDITIPTVNKATVRVKTLDKLKDYEL